MKNRAGSMILAASPKPNLDIETIASEKSMKKITIIIIDPAR